MNAQDVKEAIQAIDVALDGILPELGQGELVPIADMISKIGQKLTDAIASKGAAAPVLATEVSTADAAADAAEKAKFQ